jgi:predicted dehydrogenase
MGMMHLAAISSLPNVEVVALIDNNRKSWAVIKSLGVGGNFYENITEALKSERLDKMFILTPTFTHMNLLLECLDKGVSVFVEKPLCLNGEEIKELKRMTRKYPGRVYVGYTLLFKRAVVELKRLVETRKYGKVKGFKARYSHGEVFGPRQGWMFDRAKSGGGVLMNPGPHLFSVISYLLGMPKTISGDIRKIYSEAIDDEADLTLDYGGFGGSMFLSWSVEGTDIPQLDVEIEFEKAKVVTDGKGLRIATDRGIMTVSEKELPAVVEGIMELNPDANGEAYVAEDYLFVNSMEAPNSNLQWVFQTEQMIQDSYKVAGVK